MTHTRATWLAAWLAAGAALYLAGCGVEPPGLGWTPAGSGPVVVFDPLAKPDPEIPWPNDAATLPDDRMPTGRRLNLAVLSALGREASARAALDQADGFGVTGAISVSFDAPLDLATVRPGSVLLFDVTPSSPEFGHSIPLDLRAEAFPLRTFDVRAITPGDPLADLPDFVLPPDNDVDGERVEFYEVATNTLRVRPLVALRPATTYAVVLTRALRGLDGQPVRSPFARVHAASQARALAPVGELVPGGPQEIAFAWSFTTRSIGHTLRTLREGLDGRGPASVLARDFAPHLLDVVDLGIEHDGDGTLADKGVPAVARDNAFILQAPFLNWVLGLFGGLLPSTFAEFRYVDYFVFGHMAAPDVRNPDDGVLRVDPDGRPQAVRWGSVPFLLSVPRARGRFQPPFPVLVYLHGARTSRIEQLAIADQMARSGIAVFSFDAAGHGPIGGDLAAILQREGGKVPVETVQFVLQTVLTQVLGEPVELVGKPLSDTFDLLASIGLFYELFFDGRSEDLDGDGVLLSGDGYFTGDVPRMASATQQTVLDALSALRMLRSWGGGSQGASTGVPGSVEAAVLQGDFNADGVVDVGGPDNHYYVAGTSLGGIHTSVVAAVEPGFEAAVPIVSGGSFIDILVRTTLDQVADVVFDDATGPRLVGCPVGGDGEAHVALTFNEWSLDCRDDATVELAAAQAGLPALPVVAGATVRLVNRSLQERAGRPGYPRSQAETVMAPDGSFSLGVPADVGDVMHLEMVSPTGDLLAEVDYATPVSGLGRVRNSPRFRRLLDLATILFDDADPLAYARFLIREPMDGPARHVLHLVDVGDRTVPFSTMLAWDRTVGLLGLDESEMLAYNQAFVDRGVVEGGVEPWDVEGRLGQGDALGPLPAVEAGGGVSAVRIAALGDHEYIAAPRPDAPFDFATFHRNLFVAFLRSGGTQLPDDACLEDDSCAWIAADAAEGEPAVDSADSISRQ